jgi:uncharacterized phage-associated protein
MLGNAMKKFLPLAIANELIALSENGGVDHMRLQKLTYIVHGNWLRNHEERCLEEQPQVWQYGPVFSSLYSELKHYKNAPIRKPQTMFDDPEDAIMVGHSEVDLHQVIKQVWAKFKKYNGPQLSELTHRPGSPWYEVAKEHNFKVPSGTEIPDDKIKKYFSETSLLAI